MHNAVYRLGAKLQGGEKFCPAKAEIIPARGVPEGWPC